MIVCGGDEHLFNKVTIFGGGSLNTASSSMLKTIFGNRSPFHVAFVRYGNCHIFFSNQIFDCDVWIIFNNLCSSFITVTITDFQCFRLDDFDYSLLTLENIFQISNFQGYLLMFITNFLLLHPCKTLETHLQNCLGLTLGKSVIRHQNGLGSGTIFSLSNGFDYFIQIFKSSHQAFKNMKAIFGLV